MASESDQMSTRRSWGVRTIAYGAPPLLIIVMACSPGPLPPLVFADQVSAVCPPGDSGQDFFSARQYSDARTSP